MSKIDLSTEALLIRRKLAEKAAKRMPFEVARIVLCMGEEEREGNHKDEDDFFASNDPPTVIATIDELLRLRVQMASLEKEADWLTSILPSHLLCQYCPQGLLQRNSPCKCSYTWREVARRAVEE